MSGRSSCLRLPHAEMPAMNRAPARRSVTLRLLTASSERRFTSDPPSGRWWWTATSAVIGRVEDVGGSCSTTARSSASTCASNSRIRRELSSRKDWSVASASAVALTTTWRRSAGSSCRVRRPCDTSPSTTPVAVEEVTPSRLASSDIRRLPDCHDQVEGLGLGHRQVDEVQLGGMAGHQAVHQAVEDREQAIEVGIGMTGASRASWCGSQVLWLLRTIRHDLTISEVREMRFTGSTSTRAVSSAELVGARLHR